MPDALPIDEVLPAIVDEVRSQGRVVVEAPTGAGKSTRVAPALLDAGLTNKNILMLEPRRVAARAIATRIAAERGGKVGHEVGWHIRWDKRGNASTRLWLMTEGILTRRILSDPFLDDVGVLVLDEFHERSIHTDLALGFAKELLSMRDDLSLVVMSATLDTATIAKFLECRAIRSSGRLHPVTTQWLQSPPDDLPTAVRDAVRDLLGDDEDDGGDIVVFLPGLREIDRCRDACRGVFPSLELHRLHGRLSDSEQDAALRKQQSRKLIFATNIAETSLTISGLTTVIDSGLVRIARADLSTGFDTLETSRTSLASVEQRAGRAGRTAPGRAVRLWTQASEFRLKEYDEPEVRRVDLASSLLDIARWSGRSPREFPWFERPSDARLDAGIETLRSLGAITNDGKVTTVGDTLSDMPVHPRIGRFILQANELGVGRFAAEVAACLSEHSWVTGVTGQRAETDADVVTRAGVLRDAAAGRLESAHSAGLRVNVSAAKNTLRIARDLERFVDARTYGDPVLGAREALVPAFSDWIGFHAGGRRYALSRGGSVVLARESALGLPAILVATAIFGTTRVDGVECGIVRQGARVDEAWLPEGRVSTEVDVRFDKDLERLVARRVRRFDSLILGESPVSIHDSNVGLETLCAVLAAATAPDLAYAYGLEKDELTFLQRIDFLRHWVPELGLPDPRGDAVVAGMVWGKKSFAELRRAGFRRSYSRSLSGAHFGAVERQSPERIELRGRQFRIDYADREQPVLAARIQDFFGLTQTPTLADGRVTVLLHLLAPNRRPAQVTKDLASFWATTYAEVRKELRARYPKHDWPEDPST